jgi:ubiquinone/menaquinone biosynthesis C-methylase UbiE
MNGLLCAQILWYMHGASLRFFCQRLAALTRPGGKVLEVGPGHGLLLFLALRDLKMSEAVAWDLSDVSLEQTRHALGVLGALDRARFAVQDMHLAEMLDERFDLVILSHLLEHLEAPVEALKKLRHVIADSGLIFVNVPLNAPMPDHLILLREPGEAERMMTDGGFRVIEMSVHTTDGMPLIKALKMKTAATCSIIAKPA